jgi:hypothetical protein
MNKKFASFLLLLFVLCSSLYAKDFGLILDQTAGYVGYGSEGELEYSGTLIPRFSTPLGDNGEIFVSAGLGWQIKPMLFIPELLRTELTWYFGKGELKFGRMHYADPLGFIAEGLFDGACFSYDTAIGSLSIGAWYTGLLYKDRANIAMTPEESLSSLETIDYANFTDTYFAPRRFVSALGWEHPSLAGLLSVRAALLGQFDLSGSPGLNSQYLAAKAVMPFRAFVVELGGSFELIQAGDDFGTAFAGELGFSWMLPISIESQLALRGRFTSGVSNDETGLGAFLPLTTVSQGEVLQARVSGLSIISLAYIARFHEKFSASLSSSYFVRSDLGTYGAYPVTVASKDGYFLGNEFFARAFWSPVSDVRLNLGGGIFLPSLGNAAPKADGLWRIELNVILSLY